MPVVSRRRARAQLVKVVCLVVLISAACGSSDVGSPELPELATATPSVAPKPAPLPSVAAAQTSAPTPEPTPRPTPTAEPALQQCVDSCSVAIDESFKIVFEGNPSSGQWWELGNEAALRFVTLARQEFIAPTAGIVGVERAQTFTFDATSTGIETIEFWHVEAGATDQPIDEMSFTVTVE